MSAISGQDLLLYLYNNLEPIACEDQFVLNITSNEIITTTRGSGRATNREYGAYDWNIQCSGVLLKNPTSAQTDSKILGDNIINGQKIIVRANIDTEFYFGMGVVTSVTYTGSADDLAKFDITIAGDGILYSTQGLKFPSSDLRFFNEPSVIRFTKSGTTTIPTAFVSALLANATIISVFRNTLFINPSQYTFITTSLPGIPPFGTISFTNLGFVAGETATVFYIPA